jgi:hypothetical protein
LTIVKTRFGRWLGGGVLLAGGCTGELNAPTVPEHPTWADVQPILQGECTHCHGATAGVTGFGYRLDFYDVTMDTCGEAALALPGGILAAAAAPSILTDVKPSPQNGRARMPPAPAPVLKSWERETLLRWAADPAKGPQPASNHAPTIVVTGLPTVVNDSLDFSALLDDADGDGVIGVLKIAGTLYAMPSSGAFHVQIPTSAWPAGTQRLSAVLCDGWASASYDLGPVNVKH